VRIREKSAIALIRRLRRKKQGEIPQQRTHPLEIGGAIGIIRSIVTSVRRKVKRRFGRMVSEISWLEKKVEQEKKQSLTLRAPS